MIRRVRSWLLLEELIKRSRPLSRFVKKVDRLKRFLIVAGTEESSNCDVGVGPLCGSWKTVPFLTHGEMSIAVVRKPKRLKSNC